jgi:hypothetical protein
MLMALAEMHKQGKFKKPTAKTMPEPEPSKAT